jgi:hypothetical protein
MGYYTTYKLKGIKTDLVQKERERLQGERKTLESIEDPTVRAYALSGFDAKMVDPGKYDSSKMCPQSPKFDPFSEPCKWYEHEDDMRKFSQLYPFILFELSGEGEESGDIWKKYFLNGKMKICSARIEFEPFDETKLG